MSFANFKFLKKGLSLALLFQLVSCGSVGKQGVGFSDRANRIKDLSLEMLRTELFALQTRIDSIKAMVFSISNQRDLQIIMGDELSAQATEMDLLSYESQLHGLESQKDKVELRLYSTQIATK